MRERNCGVTSSQALRLAIAYGLALQKPEPRERPPYVPFCEALGTTESKVCVPWVTQERIELLAPMWAEGMTYKQMEQRTGLKKTTINGIVVRNRDRFPPRYTRRRKK